MTGYSPECLSKSLSVLPLSINRHHPKKFNSLDFIMHIASLKIHKKLFKAMFSLRNECSITNWKKKKGKKGFYYNQLRTGQAWFQREKRKRCKHDCFTFPIYPFQRNQETVLTASGEMAWPDPNRKGLHKDHYLNKCFKGVAFLKSILIKMKCRGVIYSRIARVRWGKKNHIYI